jgi:endo-1,4-beta-D-glucanase Y
MITLRNYFHSLNRQRWIGLGAILALVVAIFCFGLAVRHRRLEVARAQPKPMLASLWNEYKQQDLDPVSHRTIDAQRGNITTSEGESYTMLRAVWENDRTTFDQSWEWSKDNLKRPTDSLPAWLWGKEPNGTYGILTEQNGQNTASDADTDMALSLIMAGDRWHDPTYTIAGIQMIDDIWNQDVATVQGQPVLTADNLEKDDPTQVVVDPSYFAPYAYTIFAGLDPTHDWTGLETNMFSLVDQISSQPLDQSRSANIPPDWVIINRQTGSFSPPTGTDQTTDYSFDAMRLPFRLALDYEWFGNPEAKDLLSHYGFLSGQWQVTGKLVESYSHLGQALTQTEAPSIYGGSLGYFLIEHPAEATAIYQQKLLPLYDSTTGMWKQNQDYYDANWAWFGMALYTGQLPNLTK